MGVSDFLGRLDASYSQRNKSSTTRNQDESRDLLCALDSTCAVFTVGCPVLHSVHVADVEP